MTAISAGFAVGGNLPDQTTNYPSAQPQAGLPHTVRVRSKESKGLGHACVKHTRAMCHEATLGRHVSALHRRWCASVCTESGGGGPGSAMR